MQTLEAVINNDGEVRLLEPIEGKGQRRAIVIVLDEASVEQTAALTERALDDWNRAEEDAAWSHLQSAQ